MHRKLQVGSVIQMNVAAINITAVSQPVPGLGNEFKLFSNMVYRLGRPVQGLPPAPDSEPIKQGASTDPARTFLWLPYRPGFITVAPFDRSKSIVTGYMSGCWLVHCRINGREHLAHIGTANTAQDPQTIAVKNAWKLAVGTNKITTISAFQPKSLTGADTMGVLSPHANFYKLCFARVDFLPRAQPGGTGQNISGPTQAGAPIRVTEKTRMPGQQLPYAF